MALSGSMVDSTQVISIHCDRIDTAMAIRFKEYMRTQTQSNAAQVMHDLSVTEFIESSGLDDIAASIKKLGAVLRLELVDLRPIVGKVIRLTRMGSVFQLFVPLNHTMTVGVD